MLAAQFTNEELKKLPKNNDNNSSSNLPRTNSLNKERNLKRRIKSVPNLSTLFKTQTIFPELSQNKSKDIGLNKNNKILNVKNTISKDTKKNDISKISNQIPRTNSQSNILVGNANQINKTISNKRLHSATTIIKSSYN